MASNVASHRFFQGSALVAAALASALCAPATGAHVANAAPLDELQDIQRQIQANNEAYEAASARVDELQGQIDENESHIAEIEAELPVQRERAADSMRVLYKMQQGPSDLIDLILSADDFYDLITTIQYLDAIQAHNCGAVEELAATAAELDQTRATLEAQMQEAADERQEASDALRQSQSARAQLEAEIAAQAAAEAAAREAALREARAALEKDATEDAGTGETTFETEAGTEAEVEVPSSPDPGPVDWQSDKDSFVSGWASRIDAYLAGSPLAGHGTTFAEAAWAYGVDPRFSPAISMVESSQGRHCFRPHNAWGWGNASWGSWDEAIWAHVAGLASGYGGQLTYAAAQKYCPPNASHWYSSVLANMERI